MSYILDALRRADSDRERGAVPSLHSNSLMAGPVDGDEADSSARAVQPLWWAIGGLSIMLLGILGWLVFGRAAPESEPQRAAEVVAAPAVAAPTVTAPVAAASPAVPAAPAPVMPAVAAMQEPAPARPAPAKPGKPAAKPDAAPARPAPAVQAAAEAEAVPSISELPDDVRRQLPSLSVSGASYSKNAASRMLILNGQVFREGDKVASDVVLEQIRLKSAVMSYKGRRYSINF